VVNETYTQAATYRNELTVDVWYPPQFIYSELKRYALNGRNSSILCNVLRTNPPIKQITMRKNGEIIAEDLRHFYEKRGSNSKSLKIINVDDDDYGQYTCEAHNGKLVAKQVIILSKAIPPKQPKVDVLSFTNHSITFKIVDEYEDGFLPVQSYRISYWPSSNLYENRGSLNLTRDVYGGEYDEGTEVWQDIPKNPTNLYTISSLEPDTSYEFTFRARSDVGEGDSITQKVRPDMQMSLKSSSTKLWGSFYMIISAILWTVILTAPTSLFHI